MEYIFQLIDSFLPEFFKNDLIILVLGLGILSFFAHILIVLFRKILQMYFKENSSMALGFIFVTSILSFILFVLYQETSTNVFQISVILSFIVLYSLVKIFQKPYMKQFFLPIDEDAKILKENDSLEKCLNCSKRVIFHLAISQKDQTCGYCGTIHTIDREKFRRSTVKQVGFIVIGLMTVAMIAYATGLFLSEWFSLGIILVGLIYLAWNFDKKNERALRSLISIKR